MLYAIISHAGAIHCKQTYLHVRGRLTKANAQYNADLIHVCLTYTARHQETDEDRITKGEDPDNKVHGANLGPKHCVLRY